MSFKDMYKTKISTSYGVVIYTYFQNEIKFLMTLRRDTFCYECLIRGMYTSDEMMADYISHITKEEKERIMAYPFDMLWKDLWVSPKRRLYRIEYKKSKDKFTKNYDRIMELIQNLVVFDHVLWEFPKGKMFSEETPLQCALREYQEETNMSKDDVTILKYAGTFEESFYGNDHRKYQSVYYLGFIENGCDTPFTYQSCPHEMRLPYISDEVMSIAWLSYDEAFNVSSPTKQIILQNVYTHLFGNKH